MTDLDVLPRTKADRNNDRDRTLQERATLRDEVEDDELVVIEVLRPGYRCRGRLLRPAMVRVGGVEG